MTASVDPLAVVPLHDPGANPIPPADYVSARALAATTAESITIPAGAVYVRLAATADVYYSMTTTASVPGDTDDGTACELLKASGPAEWRKLPPAATAISVISAGTPIVTASFYKM